MIELEILTKILSSGGDGALIAIAWSIWKLDRRVLQIENKLNMEEK